MRIWPAIDLKGGNCVRLSQGDYKQETTYGTDPADMASRWVSEGATGLHLIDLDGAMGLPPNLDAISRIADEVDVDIQIGGGIRNQETIETFLSMGIKRLVISTKAVSDQNWIRSMTDRYPGHLLISIDTRKDRVAFDGWQQSSAKTPLEHAESMLQLPIAGLIYTDIDRAGMLSGPNTNTLKQINEMSKLPLIASGGITSLDDLCQLSSMDLDGCIIGKALYEGRLTLPQAISNAVTMI